MSTASVVDAPEPFVSLDEAKLHLRVDSDEEDELINVFRAAACAQIDGPASYMGRAIGEQTLSLILDEFPSCGPIKLPCPPVQSVTSVKYLDEDGVEQTLATSVYRVINAGRDDVAIELKVDQSWPTILEDVGAVRIVYVAGYETVPAPLKAAALLMLADLYENRETVAVGVSATEIPMSMTVKNLLANYRIF